MKKLISLVLMLVAISHATAQGPTSTKVLSDFGNSSTPLRTEKQIVEDSTSNDVTPSDSSNYDVASPSLVADATNVYTFKLTTSITSGRYMIVASDKKNNISYAATSRDETDTYKKIRGTKVAIADDVISINNENLIFTIEGDNKNGFTIKQPNGLYWKNTKSDDTNISLEKNNQKKECLWDITSGNYLMTIKNKKTDCYIALYKNYFGAYLSNQKPMLFKETGTPSYELVNVSDVGYATLYYSDLALQVPDGVTAMTYAYDKGTQTLFKSKTYKKGSVIPKGVAVVLKAPEGNYTFMVSDKEGEAPEKTNLYGYDIEATTDVEGMSAYYMLSQDENNTSGSIGFYWGQDNGASFKSDKHKAFLALPELAAAKGFAFEDIVDGISDVSTAVNNPDAIYTLTGVRMSGKLPAGIYVSKGKKFIVK